MRELRNMRMTWAPWLVVVSGMLVTAGAAELRPGKDWKFTGDNARQLEQAFDLDIGSTWTSSQPQKSGVGFTIDFGQPVAVHRLILDPGQGKHLFRLPRSLRCSMGMDPNEMEVFREDERHWQAPPSVIDLRFNAAKGRYLRLEIGNVGTGFPWTIAEMRIYGFSEKGSLDARDAVVLPEAMPERGLYNVPRDLGARDLSYYLGEITGRPVPVVQQEQKGDYPGQLFVIEEPQPVEFGKNDILHRGRQSVHVYKEGREIRFAGHSHVGVFYSVLEFLDRQGVRWIYPSVYGDWIARREGPDLSVLPLKYTPQMELRWLGGRPMFQGRHYWLPYSHWNHFFGGRGTSYRHIGHHSFASLVSSKHHAEHPDWFPMFSDPQWEAFLKTKGRKLGDRMPHAGMFCTTSQGAREHIIGDAVKRAKERPHWHSLMVGQMDSDFWCECPRCREQDRGAAPKHSKGERLADLAAHLGRRLREEVPDRPIQVATMAYVSSAYAPRTVTELPDNVSVDVVICSVRGDVQVGESGSVGSYRVFLSPDAPQNRIAVETLRGWAKVTKHLGVYSWDLIGLGSGIPKAMITSTGEWFKLWKELGVDAIEPEVSTYPERPWRTNPWAHYAYSRLAWNPEEPTAQIIQDFFNGYFRKAAEPMLAYYMTLENHIRANNMLYGQHAYILKADQAIFTPEILRTMLGHLRQAEAAAEGNYVTKRRVAGIRGGFNTVLAALDISEEALKQQ